jgi:hypothetical protein
VDGRPQERAYEARDRDLRLEAARGCDGGATAPPATVLDMQGKLPCEERM